MWCRSFNFSFFLLLLSGCGVRMCGSSRDTMLPEDVVKSYIEAAFNMTTLEEKSLLISYTTGDLKSALLKTSDDTIEEIYMKKKYEMETLDIASAQYKTPVECEVSYNLSYQENFEQNESSTKPLRLVVKAQNTVSLLKTEEGWFIEGVLGKKSQVVFPYIE